KNRPTRELALRRRIVSLPNRAHSWSAYRIYSPRHRINDRRFDLTRRVWLCRAESPDSVDGLEALQDQTIYRRNPKQLPCLYLKEWNLTSADHLLSGSAALRRANRWYSP